MSSSDEIAQALVRFTEWFNAGEIDGFDAAITADEDSFVIGTQRWATGRAEWLGNYRALVEKGLLGPSGAGLHLETSGVRGFDEGSAGWAVGWVTFVFPSGIRLPTRTTAVFRRENDGWMLRHAHFSVAVPDEVASQHIEDWMQQLDQAVL
jgi:hypothetical protein